MGCANNTQHHKQIGVIQSAKQLNVIPWSIKDILRTSYSVEQEAQACCLLYLYRLMDEEKPSKFYLLWCYLDEINSSLGFIWCQQAKSSFVLIISSYGLDL